MALNPFQQAISNLARSMGLKGQAEQQVYQTPQYQQLITQQFGNIPLPAGVDESMVVSRTPQSVEYKDAQGYIHRLDRDLDGNSPRLGEVRETSSNRPSILPSETAGGGLGQVTEQAFGLPVGPTNVVGTPQAQGQPQNLSQVLTNALANPVQLQGLDSDTQAMLKQIFDAQNTLQEDAFQKAQGTNIAQLVGGGVGASSIAGQITNQLLQGQGIVRGQQQAAQNQTQLGLQEFLTEATQQKNQQLQQYITNLLQLGTERDISGANIDTQRLQIGNQNDQFYRNLQEQIRQFEEQMRQAQRQSLIDNIFKGVAVATGTASGLSSSFGGKNANPTVSGGSYQVPPPGNPYGSLFGNYGQTVNG